MCSPEDVARILESVATDRGKIKLARGPAAVAAWREHFDGDAADARYLLAEHAPRVGWSLCDSGHFKATHRTLT